MQKEAQSPCRNRLPPPFLSPAGKPHRLSHSRSSCLKCARTRTAPPARPRGRDPEERKSMGAFENYPRITPFLWFDSNAEEAVEFYLAIFSDSCLLDSLRVGEGGPGPANSILTISFELDGQKFTALNGGPIHKFTEAISLVVRCGTQE